MELEAATESEANEMVDTACKKLLANLIMESYTFSVKAK
jgi:phosphoribosylformylglycinamidine synthase